MKILYPSENIVEKFTPSYNSKLGRNIMAVGYLPTNELLYIKSKNAYATDIIGTCNCVNCDYCKNPCYARKSAIYHHNTVIPALTGNTLQLRNNIKKHFKHIESAFILSGCNVLRYTESGEIESSEQFIELVKLAKRLKNNTVYVYTKNYEVLREYFSNNKNLPKNLFVILSVWGAVGEVEYNEFKDRKNILCFVVNNDNITPNAICPAYKNVNGKIVKTGVNCSSCGLCYGKSKKVKVIKCFEH